MEAYAHRTEFDTCVCVEKGICECMELSVSRRRRGRRKFDSSIHHTPELTHSKTHMVQRGIDRVVKINKLFFSPN